jgi:hypothetical protein
MQHSSCSAANWGNRKLDKAASELVSMYTISFSIDAYWRCINVFYLLLILNLFYTKGGHHQRWHSCVKYLPSRSNIIWFQVLVQLWFVFTKNTFVVNLSASWVSSVLLIPVAFLDHNQRYIAVGLLTAIAPIQTLCRSGYIANCIDIAPRYTCTRLRLLLLPNATFIDIPPRYTLFGGG